MVNDKCGIDDFMKSKLSKIADDYFLKAKEYNYDRILNHEIPKREDCEDVVSALHEEVYQRVGQLVGKDFAKRTLERRCLNPGNLGESDLCYPVIRINMQLAMLDESYCPYLDFRTDNFDVPSIEDFCKVVLFHEYGHQVYDEMYTVLCTEMFEIDYNTLAEAFAFWFDGQMTPGMGGLTHETAECYRNRADVKTMKHLYNELQIASADYGARCVLDNFLDVVTDAVSYGVRNVELPRSRHRYGLEFMSSLPCKYVLA